MDWGTFFSMMALSTAMYGIGKGVGKAQAEARMMQSIRMTLELNGDPIGGVHVSGFRVDSPHIGEPPPPTGAHDDL